ncbi:MAG: glycerol-3-phosphate dehydrogenase [Coxiellaceae bacterium]|nr:glycerol-3-phosphate dehydrogenase [Coxiellaceae bacterium]
MIFDLLVIGGGINGCAIASDAAGRGLSVILCEKDDLASATSSRSSKLIHGGLRYLEQYDFKLVRHALKEREILMKKAPFLIRPIEFVIPHNKHLRPVFLIRLGLFLYDFLYPKRSLSRSKKLNLQKEPEGYPLKDEYKTGFRYADCWTDDARLVVLNAMSAREHGARILTRTECQSAKRIDDHWLVECYDKLRQQRMTLKARTIVNAAGPWVADIINDVIHTPVQSGVRLVQGSHFIVKKLYEGDQAYTLQNPDGRVVFAIPYKQNFTLIGTTDTPYNGDADQASINDTEINYLCEITNQYFKKQIKKDDVIWSYSGVRALYDDHAKDPSKIKRDAHVEVSDQNGQLALVSIFGGKITTHRVLAEDVLHHLKPYFPNMGNDWTEHEKLPGGDCDGLSFSEFIKKLQNQYHWLPTETIHRYAKQYGSLCHAFLKDCQRIKDLGKHFGADLYEKEVLYLIKNEWAQTAEDILWRRTKLGLFLNSTEIELLKNYLGT